MMPEALSRSYILSLIILIFFSCQQKGVDSPTDTTPPKIVSTEPQAGADAVDVQSALTILFSEAVQEKSVAIILEHSAERVTGRLTVSEQQVIFKPDANLQYATIYTATVKAGVRDKAGNAMKQDYVWRFTTEKEPVVPDTIPPQVVSTEPADGATGVPRNVQIKVVFSEKVRVPFNGFSLKDENDNPVSGIKSVVDSYPSCEVHLS
ncbi:Ig-like domain-containing domain [Calditrichota bacterium LG25]